MDSNNIKDIIELAILPYKQKIESLQNELQDTKSSMPPVFRSNEIKEISGALAKAQSEMKIAELNKQNPYFKSSYADMMSIVSAARPALTKNGLAVTQVILNHEDGQNVLHTLLMHTSGQYIESRIRIVPPKSDIQTISSYTTYLKRMAYAALIGVVTGDEDDDGEAAVATSRETFAKGTALNTKYNPKEVSPDVITKEQLEEAEYELSEYPDICEQVLEGFKIQSLADMPKDKYHIAMKRIREIKALRNGTR